MTLVVSGSALGAERLRVDLASANLANARSTRTPEGGPYQRRDAVFASVPAAGAFATELGRAVHRVQIVGIALDPRPPREVFDPSHPDADDRGIVRLPNVQVVEESVNLMNAARSFEANLMAIRTSREMAERALRLGRVG